MKRWGAVLTGLVVLGAWCVASCSPSSFQSATVIDTVRILASRASEPRAKPGDTVRLDLLAFDGRVHPQAQMNLFWLPVPCINPKNDAYYSCFATLGAGMAPDAGTAQAPGAAAVADAGAANDAGIADAETTDANNAGGLGDASTPPLASLGPGIDLVPGPSVAFKVPSNVIISRTGASPYGLIIFFNFACAGHLKLLPFDPNSQNVQQIPIGCFDSQDNQLGPDDFVFGFTRLYVEDNPTEVNPVITQVDTAAGRLAIDGGVSAPFAVSLCGGDADTCAHHTIGPVVPPSLPVGKQVWADFYATAGTFTSSARLLYDPMATLSIPTGTDNEYVSPNSLEGTPADNSIWIVVHDDQGGADWVTVPLKIK